MLSSIRNNTYIIKIIILSIILCFVDCMLNSTPGRVQLIVQNFTGLVIGFFILSNYSARDFLKPCYYVWTAFSILLTPFAVLWGIKNYPYIGQWISIILNIILYGYIVIRIFIKLFKEKDYPIIRPINLWIWIIMFLLMFISRNENLWPLYFFIVFSSFYLTDYSEKRLNDLFLGISIGIIIGFFLLQGLALLFRPYDEVRYNGIFKNANMNALFYTLVFCAILSLIAFIVKKSNSEKIIIPLIFLCGAIIGLTLLAGSRTALISDFIIFSVFIISLFTELKKKRIIKYLLIFIVSVIVMFFPTYLSVRYIPTIHLHPIYFEGEYSEKKVLPGEPRDSEKYVSAKEVIDRNFGRFLSVFVKVNRTESTVNNATDVSEESTTVAESSSQKKQEEYLSSADVRYIIYKWYFDNLNIFGHSKNDETGVYVYKGYTAPHAHNVFLQMGFWYGIPTCLLFIYFVIQCYVSFVLLLKRKELFKACFLGCFISAFVVFGSLELVWHPGRLSFTLFFIILYFVMHLPKKHTER